MFNTSAEEATSLGVVMRNWGYQKSDMLSETTLRNRRDSWLDRLKSSDDPRYIQVCQNMIRYYQERIDRLGVRITCAD